MTKVYMLGNRNAIHFVTLFSVVLMMRTVLRLNMLEEGEYIAFSHRHTFEWDQDNDLIEVGSPTCVTDAPNGPAWTPKGTEE